MTATGREASGVFWLEERCVIKISGADAESFLQNIVTQNVTGLQAGELRYGCLLTPQGRFLHDFFIFKDNGDLFLECESARKGDLVRRLKMFKLRAKVDIDETDFLVYAGENTPAARLHFSDPRLSALGFRSYLAAGETAVDASSFYKDRRIRLGVPEGGGEIRPEIDTLSDVSLDRLNAVSWDKGCFVGQEVTARMKNRGLAKKRLVVVSGAGLSAGGILTQDGRPVGEVRAVNAAGEEALAVLKLAAVEAASGTPIVQADGGVITAHFPM